MSKYKYLTTKKLQEILDNPTQMDYEDKYCDEVDLITSALADKLTKANDKSLKEYYNFTKQYPHKLSMYDPEGNKICSDLNVKEVSDQFKINNLFTGDIFDLSSLIDKVNNIINPLFIVLEDN